jgi:transcription elongation factor Elf1
MSLYIDKKYVSLLAPKLQQFKVRGEFLWNFRCPVCGDSHKNKIKARGYIYKRKDNFSFMCHNCGTSMSFVKFLKVEDPHLYKEYLLEKYSNQNTEPKIDITKFVTKPSFKLLPKDINLPTIQCLAVEHPAKQYLINRHIPKKALSTIYYASDYKEFIQELVPENTKQLYKEERIIIPFYDKDDNLLGVQGRAIGPSNIKYITIKTNEDNPKIFGWNTIDTSKRIYVVEGPIDSLFLENCVATMDASLYHAASIIGLDKDYTFVYDNEPRNKQIVSNMNKTIAQGKNVCIWPDTIKAKDINEMILSGMSAAAIQHIIDTNTFSGLQATMKLNIWSKV